MSRRTTPHQTSVNRRHFMQGSAATFLTAASYQRVLGANERIGVGFIGYGLIGKRHVIDFQEQPDVNMAAIAEAHHGRLAEAADFIGGNVKPYEDFRKLLDDSNVHAVVVSTPDHWHAPMTMLACAAGKDVYVEKPLTLFVHEGRWMVDIANHYERVVQVGTQQRSGPHYRQANELIRSGAIGDVVSVSMGAFRNIMPGYGSPADGSPPAEFDYDMWLGPAPLRPYNANRGIYHFRWFWDYSGGQMTNLGQHSLDIVHWILEANQPLAVSSAGGRFCLQDNGETPDTQDAIMEYPGWTATWSHREGSRGRSETGGLDFHGTRGSLKISRGGFQITADRRVHPSNTVPQFTGAHPVGGPQAVAEPAGERTWTKPMTNDNGDSREQFKLHVRNFLDCMRTRQQPVSELESGHRVATVCHLSNLSLRLGRKLRWDFENETIIDDPEAAALLSRPYRAPWDAELRGIGVPTTS